MVEDENERSVHSTVLLLLGTFSILRFHSSVPGIKLRSFATRTNENLLVEKKKICPHIRISPRQPASRFLTGRGVRSENARDIHEKFTIITRQDAQRIFNGASTGGHPPVFFPPPPPLLFLSRILGIRVDSGNLRNEFDRARSVVGWNIFIQMWFSLHFFCMHE